MGDDFRAWKEYKQKKKDEYRSKKMKDDIQAVVNASSFVEEKNHGEHLIVNTNTGRVIDYWPSTKRWIVRRGKSKGYDIESLLSYLKKNKGYRI